MITSYGESNVTSELENNSKEELLVLMNSHDEEKQKHINFCGAKAGVYENGNQTYAFDRDKYVFSMIIAKNNVGNENAEHSLNQIHYMQLALELIDDGEKNIKVKRRGYELHRLYPKSLGAQIG